MVKKLRSFIFKNYGKAVIQQLLITEIFAVSFFTSCTHIDCINDALISMIQVHTVY